MANKYVQVDIVARSGFDAAKMKLLDSKYDPFFKIASGLEIADQADGDVESPQGWFAFIDMSAEKHAEVVTMVDQLTEGYDVSPMPDRGYYVTETNSDGIIFAFEFQTRLAAWQYYAGLVEAHGLWSAQVNRADVVRKPSDYVWIKAWGQMMQSLDYYIEREQTIAVEDDAPITSIYRDPGMKNSWHTIADVLGKATREWLISWARENNIEIPEDVTQAWSQTLAR